MGPKATLLKRNLLPIKLKFLVGASASDSRIVNGNNRRNAITPPSYNDGDDDYFADPIPVQKQSTASTEFHRPTFTRASALLWQPSPLASSTIEDNKLASLKRDCYEALREERNNVSILLAPLFSFFFLSFLIVGSLMLTEALLQIDFA